MVFPEICMPFLDDSNTEIGSSLQIHFNPFFEPHSLDDPSLHENLSSLIHSINSKSIIFTPNFNMNDPSCMSDPAPLPFFCIVNLMFFL